MTTLVWGGFVAVVLVFLALDLGVFHRRPQEISVREALRWTALWVAMALLFAGVVYHLYESDSGSPWTSGSAALGGRAAALQYLTGYLLEKSLSVDNIFVIALIFTYFRVPLAQQHRVLFWGILGALVLRGAMIAAGAVLMHRFAWTTYVFGGLLLLTALRMALHRGQSFEPEKSRVVRLVRRWVPVTPDFDGSRFFTTRDGIRMATPLFLALVLVEATDVMFAVDSIPAVFAVTSEPFIVYTSNVFAVLGLRSLYFALAPMLDRFRYLRASLVVILAYIGVKMILAHVQPVPPLVSLVVVATILLVGVVASLLAGGRGGGSGAHGNTSTLHPRPPGVPTPAEQAT